MSLASSTVTMPNGPLAGGAFPPNQVVNGYITVVNGVGTAAVIDHIKFPVFCDTGGAAVNGTLVFGVVPPAIPIASGATVVVPISCVAQAPMAQTLATQGPLGATRFYIITPVVYTTDGQVVSDDANGNQQLSITAVTWNTGGGG